MIRLVGKAGEPARSLQRRTTVIFALSTGCDRSKMLRFANAIIACLQYNPSVMTLDAMAAALNTSMVDLLRGAFK